MFDQTNNFQLLSLVEICLKYIGNYFSKNQTNRLPLTIDPMVSFSVNGKITGIKIINIIINLILFLFCYLFYYNYFKYFKYFFLFFYFCFLFFIFLESLKSDGSTSLEVLTMLPTNFFEKIAEKYLTFDCIQELYYSQR